jgi:SAM-dependent methyltransferase
LTHSVADDAQPDQCCSAPRPTWLSPLYALDEKFLFPYRYARLTELLSPQLQGCRTVLDVGASCGRLGRRLADATGCQIMGIDVWLQPESYIEVRPYDGETFPFGNATFDCVMMVDMLHHTLNIQRMISEARRVARRCVVIKDHYWDTRLDLAGLRLADALGNAPYGISLPENYLRLDQWADLFRAQRLTIAHQRTFRLHPLEPVKNLIVRLAVPEGDTA